MTFDDPTTERRVVFAMICERGAFERCADLGLPDLTDYRLRAILTAVRALPNHAEDVSLEAVLTEIAVRDLSTGSRLAELVSWEWVAAQFACWTAEDYDSVKHGVEITPSYRGEWQLLERDLRWLRTLSARREKAMAA